MKIKIPSDIKLVHKTSAEMLQSLKEFKIDKSILYDLRLSCEEALINAIRHGNKENLDLFVDVKMYKHPEKVEIIIEDEGKGFNFEELPDPTLPENIEKGSGRGVYLISKLMDKVEFFNRGRGVRLIKYIKHN